MADKTEIFNLALSLIGERSSVASPTETSRQAEVCNLWYETARDTVLHAAPWSVTRSIQRLSVLSERDWNEEWVAGNPSPEYSFAYALPDDFLRARNLYGFQRFTIGLRQNGASKQRVLQSHVEDAILVYTSKQDLIPFWDPSLKMAVVWSLAAHICMGLTGKGARMANAVDRSNRLILEARVNDANQNSDRYDSLPDWIAARGVTPSSDRYVFPVGEMLSMQSISDAAPVSHG